MTTNTPRGYPKPDNTDPFAQGYAQIGALADAVDADVAKLPRGVIDVQQGTADVANGTGSVMCLATTVALKAGRRYRVSAQVNLNINYAGGAFCEARINHDGALAAFAWVSSYSANANISASPLLIVEPTADANHDFAVVLVCNAGTVAMKATTTNPSWLIVEDVGAAA